MREWEVPEVKATSVGRRASGGRVQCIGERHERSEGRGTDRQDARPEQSVRWKNMLGALARSFVIALCVRGRNAVVKNHQSAWTSDVLGEHARRTFKFKRRRLQAGIARLQRTVLPRKSLVALVLPVVKTGKENVRGWFVLWVVADSREGGHRTQDARNRKAYAGRLQTPFASSSSSSPFACASEPRDVLATLRRSRTQKNRSSTSS